MSTLIDKLLITDDLPSELEVIQKVRRFYLKRNIDESGISGVGIVAVGSELPSGQCVLEWQGKHKTIEITKNIDAVITIHGHDGKTQVIWIDNKN